MNSDKPLKTFPVFAYDKEAERFVDTADLSDYDLSGFKPALFEFAGNDMQRNGGAPDTPSEVIVPVTTCPLDFPSPGQT